MYGKTSCAGISLKKRRTLKDNSNITPELLETVERFYNGTMAQQERVAFKEKIEKDIAFKTLVEDIRISVLGIETQALKEQLEDFHKEIPEHNLSDNPDVKMRLLSFSKLAIAAVIILALGLFWFYSSPSNERLYAKYFTPDPGLPTTMSSSNNFMFYDAMVNYKQGDYSTAISKWRKLEQKTPNNDTLNYFLGVAHLANKNVEKAVAYLDRTTSNSESVFLQDAYYYLGLAHLKSGEIEKAREEFEKSNSEKSQEILKSIN